MSSILPGHVNVSVFERIWSYWMSVLRDDFHVSNRLGAMASLNADINQINPRIKTIGGTVPKKSNLNESIP